MFKDINSVIPKTFKAMFYYVLDTKCVKTRLDLPLRITLNLIVGTNKRFIFHPKRQAM